MAFIHDGIGKWLVDFHCLSVPTSAVKSSLLIFTDLPALIVSGIFSMTENMRSKPTAVSIEPSIMPTGGTRKPPMITAR